MHNVQKYFLTVFVSFYLRSTLEKHTGSDTEHHGARAERRNSSITSRSTPVRHFFYVSRETSGPARQRCTVAHVAKLNLISPNKLFSFSKKPGEFQKPNYSVKVARNEVENASFAQRSAHRDSRIWRPELIEPAAQRKRRARGRRPTVKSAYPDPQILPQCNISSNYPYNVWFF